MSNSLALKKGGGIQNTHKWFKKILCVMASMFLIIVVHNYT
jgi:hypothetical protein